MISVPVDRSWGDFRHKARELLAQEVPPTHVEWVTEASGLFLGEAFVDRQTPSALKLPRDFIQEASIVACHRDDGTWDLLYRLLWRLAHGERELLRISVDPDVREFESRRKSVGRDLHKMHAFVRFREVAQDDGSVFISWYRPDHRILRLAAPFFKDRFNGMRWTIMTEDESVRWDMKELHFFPGIPRQELPPDEKEDLWKTYYSSIFNPARVKVGMMKKEMAVRYWETMPETQLIADLLKDAPARVHAFAEQQLEVKAPTQLVGHLSDMANAMKKCQACGICAQSKGPVAGAGPYDAGLVFVGEQPGNEEDQQGTPFVGPAGQLLLTAFAESGINPKEAFLTNAVKGFKWVGTHLARQHRTASGREISACRPWLQTELELLKPKLLVCLGRTAAQSVLGKMVRVEDVRGTFFATPSCAHTIILPHPASILRTVDPAERAANHARFLAELKLVREAWRALKQ